MPPPVAQQIQREPSIVMYFPHCALLSKSATISQLICLVITSLTLDNEFGSAEAIVEWRRQILQNEVYTSKPTGRRQILPNCAAQYNRSMLTGFKQLILLLALNISSNTPKSEKPDWPSFCDLPTPQWESHRNDFNVARVSVVGFTKPPHIQTHNICLYFGCNRNHKWTTKSRMSFILIMIPFRKYSRKLGSFCPLLRRTPCHLKKKRPKKPKETNKKQN